MKINNINQNENEKKKKKKKKKERKLHYIDPKGKFYVTTRAALGDLGLKSHPKDNQQKLIYNTATYPSTN